MELIKYAQYRTVEYFGEELAIPKHHCYVATDAIGEVFSFYNRPYCKDGEWVHDDEETVHSVQYIAQFSLQEYSAEDTLAQYPIITLSVI